MSQRKSYCPAPYNSYLSELIAKLHEFSFIALLNAVEYNCFIPVPGNNQSVPICIQTEGLVVLVCV